MWLPFWAVFLSITIAGATDTKITDITEVLDELPTCLVQYRLWVNEVQYQACDKPIQTREKRFYYLLAAEIPAWICPWLRLFSSWRSLEGVRGDDYVMSACWVFYTIYILCVHIVHHNVFDVDASQVGEQGVINGLKCSPVSFSWLGWSLESDDQRCLDLHLLYYLKLGFDIGQTAIVLVLPLPLLRQLNMQIQVKLGAGVMFALGVLAIAMSGLRLRCVVTQTSTAEQPWEYDDRLIWTGIEVSTLIILACAPGIWKLLVPAAPTTIPTFTSRRSLSRSSNHMALPPIKTNSKGGASVLRKPSKGHYSSTKGKTTKRELDLDLQLGDKARGDVWTQIKAGHRFSGFSMISHVGDRLGIRVKTTTTTRVEVEDSDGDEGSLVTPKPGPLSP
ncbi:CFEM domain-containing protein [Ilyonectria robusta]